MAVAQHGDNHVVAVGEDVCAHIDVFTRGALDWKATVIDSRAHVFDNNAARQCVGRPHTIERSFPGGVWLRTVESLTAALGH